MKIFFAFAIFAAASACFAACGTAPIIGEVSKDKPETQKLEPDSLAMNGARNNYAQACARCHAADGAGGVVQIGDFSLKVPSLKDADARGETDDAYRRKILNGGDGMPKFKDKFRSSEIDDLVIYIRSQFQGK